MDTLRTRLTAWSKRNRFNLQLTALGLLILAPFGLYAALSAGIAWLSVIFFASIAVGLVLTLWAG